MRVDIIKPIVRIRAFEGSHRHLSSMAWKVVLQPLHHGRKVGPAELQVGPLIQVHAVCGWLHDSWGPGVAVDAQDAAYPVIGADYPSAFLQPVFPHSTRWGEI